MISAGFLSQSEAEPRRSPKWRVTYISDRYPFVLVRKASVRIVLSFTVRKTYLFNGLFSK